MLALAQNASNHPKKPINTTQKQGETFIIANVFRIYGT